MTLDALNCQTKIAEAIVEKEADYLLALKGNQGSLHDDVSLLFETLAEDVRKKAHYAYSHDHTMRTYKRLASVRNVCRLIPYLAAHPHQPMLAGLLAD